MVDKKSELVERQEVIDDLGEILNNINDDLLLDLDVGEDGYKSYKESYKAVMKYALKVIIKKYKKYGGKLMKD